MDKETIEFKSRLVLPELYENCKIYEETGGVDNLVLLSFEIDLETEETFLKNNPSLTEIKKGYMPFFDTEFQDVKWWRPNNLEVFSSVEGLENDWSFTIVIGSLTKDKKIVYFKGFEL